MTTALLRAFALGTLLASAAPARQAQDSFEAFPAFLWLRDARGSDAPTELVASVGGIAFEANTPPEWYLQLSAAQRLPAYLGHAPGRNTLHPERDASWVAGRAEFEASRASDSWHRRPDLFDPAVIAALHARLRETVESRPTADWRAISLGDEVAYTPFGDPAELAPSVHERDAWRAWLARDGAQRFALDPASALPSTEACLRRGDTGAFARFLARRAFERERLTDVLVQLAEAARAHAPDVPVALLGCAGETTFHGLDFQRLLEILDVVEPYAVGHARELLTTLRWLEARRDHRVQVWTTLFADRGAIDLDAQFGEIEYFGSDAAVVWNDAALSLAEPLVALERGLVKLRASPPKSTPPDVALVHDFDSLARCWFLDARRAGASWPALMGGHQARHGTRERAERALLDSLRASGARPGVVPIERVDAALADVLPHLVLLELRVLDDVEAEQLRAYRRAGGRIEVRGRLWELRPDGRPGDARLGPELTEALGD